MTFAQIILPLNLKETYTYKIPDSYVESLEIGMRVLVPFRGKKIYTGIVFSIHNQEPETFIPKPIISILDQVPILPLEQIKFWTWLSDYYLCSLGEIYRYSFPSSLKLESETYLKLIPNVEINYQILDVNETYLIQALEVRQLINLSEVEAFIPKKDLVKTVNALIDLKYIEIDEKVSEKYKAKEVVYVQLNKEKLELDGLPNILSELKRAPKQQELFLLILDKATQNPEQPIRKSDLFTQDLYSYSQLKSLIEKSLVEEYVLQHDRIEAYTGEMELVEKLSDVQETASRKIDLIFKDGKPALLHGVTSSGKTHIYLQKVEECISTGKNALFLLPEISLTKQIIQRLEKKYGSMLGFYHQKLTDFERVEVWKKIKNNELRIIIGTRNSLFLPFANLGLIIVDEEHDSAYRPKDVAPHFNAKDSVLVLAKCYDAKVLLGSATPSVETYHLAQKGKMGYVYLGERYGNVSLPEFQLINFKEEQEAKRVDGNFSFQLIDDIRENIENHKQNMILHNRRGYSNVIECESCGYVHYCTNCDVVLTYHKASNEMKCHYCGQKAAKPQICPKCHSDHLNERGIGVEKIHEELSKIFPEAEVDRMDVDSMRRKFAYEKLYEKIESGESDIIVGTQMISKGLDFSEIELVGIPRADQMLYVQDFRAEERAYQLITQVSGRAGRVSGKGKVLIQTYNPDHSVFTLIRQKDSAEIYNYLLEERKKYNYPPFTKLILIELKHRNEGKADRASQFLGSLLRRHLPEMCVFGPEKSPIARINLLYQYQILLKLPKGKSYKKYKELVLQSLNEFEEVSAYQSIKKQITVDF